MTNCACLGPPGDCPCLRRAREDKISYQELHKHERSRVFYAHLPPFEDDVSEKVDEILTTSERRHAELTAVLRECAEDLEAEIEAKYALIKNPRHQDVMLRYEEDMTPIRKAKRLLGKYK